jgi:histidyl-tRNA synthetase
MSQLQPVRGTHDLLFDEARKHQYVIQTCRELTALYGFEEIHTPIFEVSQVFNRTLGDTSDIVSKEMYTFEDKGGDQLCLRPEGTAGIVRAFLSNELKRQLPLKFFSHGPMFRYERPQKGRYRQFHQLDVELLGVDSPQADIEVIAQAALLLKNLGIEEFAVLEINSIGDKESRDKYRSALVEYYKKHEASLSEDSKKRLSVNPLRILDSKDKNDVQINLGAPKLTDYLNEVSLSKFNAVKAGLESLGIKFLVNPSLVRGLDYYCHTVFEFRTTHLGSQDAILSGGRYDGLVELMGGDPTPGVGWAAGIERLVMLLKDFPKPERPVSLIPLGEAAEKYCLKLSQELRAQGFSVELAYGGNMSNRMKKATRANARFAVIVGDNELASGELGFKDLDSGEQAKVSAAALIAKLR